MNLLVALFLGILQGLTEFFPVSSSSHLKLAKLLLGVDHLPVLFDLCLHAGSLAALIVYFRKDIWALLTTQRKALFLYLIALVPLVPLTLFLAPVRKAASSTQLLGPFLLITSLLLFLGSSIRFKLKQKPKSDALLIGLFQSTALLPGISRSASTISCAQSLGWSATDAVRFSFLLAIPTIMGGTLLEGYSLFRQEGIAALFNLYCAVGFIAAFGVGLLIVPFAMRILMQGKLKRFAWYCLFLGIGTWIGMCI